MKTIKCTACGRKTEVEQGLSVGAQMNATGYHPVMTYSGGILWVCPEDWGKVQELAHKLYELLGSDDLYFPNLM